jgi:hypothetical protein
MSGKLTKAQRRALEWFVDRGEPAHLFAAGDPSLTVVRRLRDRGFVHVVGREPGRVFGFARFDITPAGRAALTKDTPENG